MNLNIQIQQAISSAANVAHQNRVLMQKLIAPTASLVSFDDFYTPSNDDGKGELLTISEKKLIESLKQKLPAGAGLDLTGVSSIYRAVGGSEVVDLRLLKTICLLNQNEYGKVLEFIRRDCVNNETVMQVIASCSGNIEAAWSLVDKVAWPNPQQAVEENGLAKTETTEPLDAVTIAIPAAVFMASVLDYQGNFNSSVVKIGPFSWNYNPRIVDDQGRFKLLIDGGKRGFSPNLSIMESDGVFFIVNGGTSIRALMDYALERRDLHPAIRLITKNFISNQGLQFGSVEEEVGQLEADDIRLLTNALPTLYIKSLSTSEAIHFVGIASNSHTPINPIHSGVDRDYVPSIAPLLFKRLIDGGVVRSSVETLIRSTLNFKAFMLNEGLKITVLKGYFPVGCEEVGEGNPKAWGTAQAAGLDLSWLSLPYVVSFGENMVMNIAADAVDNSKLHTKLLAASLLGKCSLPKGGTVHIEIDGSTIKKCYPTSATTHGWYNRGVALINAKFSYRCFDGSFIPLSGEKRVTAADKKSTPAADKKSTPAVDTVSPAVDKKSTPAVDTVSPAADKKSPAVDKKSTPAADKKSTPAADKKSPAADKKSPAADKKSTPAADMSKVEGLLLERWNDLSGGPEKKMTGLSGASSTLEVATISTALPNLLAMGAFTDVTEVAPKDFIDELNESPQYKIKKGVENAKEFLATMVAKERDTMNRLAEVEEATLIKDKAVLANYFTKNTQAAYPASTYKLVMRPIIGAIHAKRFERLGGKISSSTVVIEGDSGKIDSRIIGYLPPQKGAKLSTLVLSLASLGEGVDEYLHGMEVPYATTAEMATMIKIMEAAVESKFFEGSVELDKDTATAIVEKLIKVFSVNKK